ncbi:hypothetical protein [Sponge holobiont-associated RNA virus]|nr:hypothetical protein [Sponge holobiont-associated RNA virus]
MAKSRTRQQRGASEVEKDIKEMTSEQRWDKIFKQLEKMETKDREKKEAIAKQEAKLRADRERLNAYIHPRKYGDIGMEHFVAEGAERDRPHDDIPVASDLDSIHIEQHMKVIPLKQAVKVKEEDMDAALEEFYKELEYQKNEQMVNVTRRLAAKIKGQESKEWVKLSDVMRAVEGEEERIATVTNSFGEVILDLAPVGSELKTYIRLRKALELMDNTHKKRVMKTQLRELSQVDEVKEGRLQTKWNMETATIKRGAKMPRYKLYSDTDVEFEEVKETRFEDMVKVIEKRGTATEASTGWDLKPGMLCVKRTKGASNSTFMETLMCYGKETCKAKMVYFKGNEYNPAYSELIKRIEAKKTTHTVEYKRVPSTVSHEITLHFDFQEGKWKLHQVSDMQLHRMKRDMTNKAYKDLSAQMSKDVDIPDEMRFYVVDSLPLDTCNIYQCVELVLDRLEEFVVRSEGDRMTRGATLYEELIVGEGDLRSCPMDNEPEYLDIKLRTDGEQTESRSMEQYASRVAAGRFWHSVVKTVVRMAVRAWLERFNTWADSDSGPSQTLNHKVVSSEIIETERCPAIITAWRAKSKNTIVYFDASQVDNWDKGLVSDALVEAHVYNRYAYESFGLPSVLDDLDQRFRDNYMRGKTRKSAADRLKTRVVQCGQKWLAEAEEGRLSTVDIKQTLTANELIDREQDIAALVAIGREHPLLGIPGKKELSILPAKDLAYFSRTFRREMEQAKTEKVIDLHKTKWNSFDTHEQLYIIVQLDRISIQELRAEVELGTYSSIRWFKRLYGVGGCKSDKLLKVLDYMSTHKETVIADLKAKEVELTPEELEILARAEDKKKFDEARRFRSKNRGRRGGPSDFGGKAKGPKMTRSDLAKPKTSGAVRKGGE